MEALGSPSLEASWTTATTSRKYWTTQQSQMDDSGRETGSSQYAQIHTHTHPYISASKTKKQNLCCTGDNFSYVFQVNRHDVTSVADDVAMTILRSTPRRLSMTVGRAVTNLVAPPSCDSLPDVVIYKTPSGQLGM